MSSSTAVPSKAKTPAPATKQNAPSEDVSPTSVMVELEKGTVPHVTLVDSNEKIALAFLQRRKQLDRRGNRRRRFGRNQRLEAQPQVLANLTSKMPQAAFGKGNETVYDNSIQKALHLSADKFEIDIPEDNMNDILESIKTKLHIKTDLVAERYSLNAYEKRGKFAKHKDTPRGEVMLGMLVLCLPSLFEGGMMEVTMGDEVHNYFGKKEGYSSYSSPSSGHSAWWGGIYGNGEPDFSKIPWCAFFADVDHEIHQVKNGLRVTVAYLLRRKDQQSASPMIPRSLKEEEQIESLRNSLSQALRSESFMPDEGTLGFPCNTCTQTNKFSLRRALTATIL